MDSWHYCRGPYWAIIRIHSPRGRGLWGHRFVISVRGSRSLRVNPKPQALNPRKSLDDSSLSLLGLAAWADPFAVLRRPRLDFKRSFFGFRA